MRDLLEMLTSVDLLVSLLSWSHQSVVVALTKATYARMKRTPAMQPSKTSLLKDQTSAHKWTRLERLLCTSPHAMPELMLLRSCWTPIADANAQDNTGRPPLPAAVAADAQGVFQ